MDQRLSIITLSRRRSSACARVLRGARLACGERGARRFHRLLHAQRNRFRPLFPRQTHRGYRATRPAAATRRVRSPWPTTFAHERTSPRCLPKRNAQAASSSSLRRMSSGAGIRDISRIPTDTFGKSPGTPSHRSMTRETSPGSRWDHSTQETASRRRLKRSTRVPDGSNLLQLQASCLMRVRRAQAPLKFLAEASSLTPEAR